MDVLSFRLVFPSASPRKLGPSSVGQESVSLLVYKSDQGECNSIPSTLAKLEGQANKLREFERFNLAMLARQGQRLIKQPEAFCAQI